MNDRSTLRFSLVLLVSYILVAVSCKHGQEQEAAVSVSKLMEDSMSPQPEVLVLSNEPDYDTLHWADLAEVLLYAEYDIKYAGTDNFTGEQIYDCPRCLVRKELAAALLRVERTLHNSGYGLLIFDCYRPAPYQQKLWSIKPDARYVMPPAKGSNHSRGTAIDLTLIDMATSQQLDMGSPFDFFGTASHTDHSDFEPEVLQNRKLLQDAMKSNGFRTIRTEWWHFDFNTRKYEPEDFLWICP